MEILVIGDSCEDVFIYGDINRIAPEAPVPVIKPKRTTENPGMAANVVANLEALGAEVQLITNSEQMRKIRYMDERYNQMVLRVDENDKCDRYDGRVYFPPVYDAMVISDYNKGFLTEADIEVFAGAKCPVFLDTKKFLGNWCNDIDFIKINSLEHQKNFERLPNYPQLIDKLIITKGKYGCEYKGKIYPTTDVPVKDVSGAGDTFIAGLVYEYVKTNDIEKAINFAQVCTTKVVQKSGVATI
jgi:D-beta-D-heptose 7-phosphate kinase/D-beta-D-heptose 1-phosphate adenosyltransferase